MSRPTGTVPIALGLRANLPQFSLLVAVFPANVQMALDLNRKGSARAKAIGFARLPLQLPLIRAALKAAREG